MKRRHFLIGTSALALATPTLGAPYFGNGPAASGYDVVAYFTLGKPVAGDAAISYDWDGATWLFSSAEHRDQFMQDPAKYAPKYGGYCAYAVSRGYSASADPKAWTVHEGALYLNFSKSVRTLWNAKRSQNIISGDENWPSVKAGL